MKSIRIFLVMAALGCMVPASAQKMFASGKYTAMCSYYGEEVTGDINFYNSDAVAESVVKNIMSVVGLHPNFELRAANVPNAAAVILQNKRYILYNPKFMNQINEATGSNWAAISILAHEIGHHLNGHTLDNVGSRPETELEADEFSGFVLRRMGASLADAQAVMGLIASMKGSHSHPAKKDRLTYIASGWNNAGGLMENTSIAEKKSDKNIEKPAVVKNPQIEHTSAVVKQTVAVRNTSSTRNTPAKSTTAVRSTAPVRKQPSARPVASVAPKPAKSLLDDKYIVSDAYFNADPKGKYYITTKGHFVQVDTNNIYMLGRLAQSNKEGYSLMLSDKNYNYLYIGQGGSIINGAGKQVGYLKVRE
jgi:hypothetical protein